MRPSDRQANKSDRGADFGDLWKSLGESPPGNPSGTGGRVAESPSREKGSKKNKR
jgi:hypothetical protein